MDATERQDGRPQRRPGSQRDRPGGRQPRHGRGWRAAAVAAALALVATACGGQVGAGGRFGVVYLDAQGYYAGVREGLRTETSRLGDDVQLLELNARGDASAESSFVDTVSSAGVDALVLSPVSATASVPAIRLAHESGIPVVCYNTCVDETAAERYVSAYVLGDPVAFGRASGEQLAAHFTAEGVPDPTIAVVNCEFVEVCIERREGFEAALAELLPGAEVVANQEGATLDDAVQVADRILTATPDLDAFYAEAGGATAGAVRAVTARGSDAVVFGSDMSTQTAQQLVDGSVLKGVTDISGTAVGVLAAQAAEAARSGELTGYEVVPAPIDAYVGPEQGQEWLDTHPDGIP